MPRGRRKALPDVSTLEKELEAVRLRGLELRKQIRLMRNSSSEITKLEEKLAKQFATAKWTVGQIKAVKADYDDVGFYHSVAAKQPAPRGRRKKVVETA